MQLCVFKCFVISVTDLVLLTQYSRSTEILFLYLGKLLWLLLQMVSTTGYCQLSYVVKQV